MARTNTKPRYAETTHEGAPAFPHLTPIQQLRRSVLSCMLWEGEFYEDGVAIADRIAENAAAVTPASLAALAIEARSQFNLRHVPLLLLCVLARTGAGTALVSETIRDTIQRPDELAEFLALYWKSGKRPLSAQVKKGLAAAFRKFSAYSLAKYNRDSAIKLRDVLFLVHGKPKDQEQADVWKRLVDGTLEAPDTWEVALSAGKDKRETWERLLREEKLGYLALLRNLRNMEQAGVGRPWIQGAILARKGAERVLPFRYIAAARHAPWAEPWLDQALQAALGQMPTLGGRTVIVIDVSGSMGATLSGKSEMTRFDAAAALAIVLRGVCEDADLWLTAGSDMQRKHATKRIAPRRGMAIVDQVQDGYRTLGGGGIFLTPCLEHIQPQVSDVERLIVVTDEQDCAVAQKDSPLLAAPFGRHNYLINVASAKNGIGYGKWLHLDGFSEAAARFIAEHEAQRA